MRGLSLDKDGSSAERVEQLQWQGEQAAIVHVFYFVSLKYNILYNCDQQLGNIDRYVLSIEGTIEFYLYSQKEPICRLKKRISNLLMIGCEKKISAAIKLINQIEVLAYRHLVNILIIVLSCHIVNKLF